MAVKRPRQQNQRVSIPWLVRHARLTAKGSNVETTVVEDPAVTVQTDHPASSTASAKDLNALPTAKVSSVATTAVAGPVERAVREHRAVKADNVNSSVSHNAKEKNVVLIRAADPVENVQPTSTAATKDSV